MADTNLIERYQDFRTRQFLRNERHYRTWLPGWRTRTRRRIVVTALVATLLLMTAAGMVCHFDITGGGLLWLAGCLLFIPLWTTLQIVSGRLGDAPRDALDEWEIQQRNSARSIGLTVTQVLTSIPALYLVLGIKDGDQYNVAYAAGLLVLTAVIIGGCLPAMILGWTQPDPEPDDLPS
ncbi:hypothetical protein BFN03_13740 [Rhodococcus sp. WMMA185]|uniref:hypothetical protein n=1 Tax=Rhodococcus sp. WMMA185 TaxID=679318 RepID=UPI0008783D4E|nr:hypothetical protein [Rhodococcus sp. WMMA185]AOW93353.1 hypothetical protein BFN03_13740 [Rhodococcus sp. WMMA185]